MLDISIVIPVYNKEKFISECLDSAISQKFPKDRYEILCINDGSTDNSVSIIQQYIKKYSNITVINKKNGGVSSARNVGIKNAKGRYILFIDADDSISENTIKDIVAFFDSVTKEVDIVTYNIYYKNNGKIKRGNRGKNINSNCIIDVTKNIDFSQTTMNICIKNTKKFYFDESFTMYEDQIFNTINISSTAKIGWCNTAKYYYNRDASNTSILNHPYFSYSAILKFFNTLLELGKEHKNMDDYCKSLILYNLDWRIKGDYFFPYHNNGGQETIDAAMQAIIDSIDNRLILKNQWLCNDHKSFLMNLKTKNKPFIIYEDKYITTCDNNGELCREKSFTLCIQRERIHGDRYHIMGFLKNTAINFGVKPRLFIAYDGIFREIELYESTESRFWTKIKTNSYYGMDTEIILHDNLEISFFVCIEDNKYPVSLWFRPYSGISSDAKINFHFSQEYSIEYKGAKLYCHSTNSPYIQDEYKKFTSRIKKEHYGKYIIHELARFIKKHCRIWLYSDANGYYDNAYIQFKHDVKKKDGVFNFYIYKDSTGTAHRGLSFWERVFCIKEKSFLHRLLFIASEKIFTSFFEKGMYIPYEKSYKFYSDIINFEGIYLQHGIMHASLDHMYAKDKSFFIDKIAVSTFFEKDIAYRRLHFNKNDIIESGAPRYSILKKTPPKNKIIYAPSWRYYLLRHAGLDTWHKASSQQQFDFIRTINELLENQDFVSFLGDNKLHLDIKLHRNFKMYEDEIKLSSSHMTLVTETSISDYKLCISDISSFIFDFAFLNIPIIKFIPDINLIRAGLHSYREFNFDLSEIGDCVYTVKELINAVKRSHSENFRPNYDKNKIFLPAISESTENIYRYIYGEK